MTKIVFASLLLSLLLPFSAVAKVEWTVVVYAALDEQEIAAYSKQAIKDLMYGDLPENVELLIELDDWRQKDGRYVRDPSSGHKLIEHNLTLDDHNPAEYDSADPKHLSQFVKWVQGTADPNSKKLWVIMAHSWGWKGLLQDFAPNKQSIKDTMMPLREFSKAFTINGVRADVMVFDACVLGNVEAVEEFAEITRYLLVSQKETPYAGMPWKEFFALIRGNPSPRSFSQIWPDRYVRAYARGGSKVKKEREYFVTTITALDMEKWGVFRGEFTKFVQVLRASNFTQKLKQKKVWRSKLVDLDFNADVVEFLRRVPTLVDDQAVKASADGLLQLIGYPEDVSAESSQVFEIEKMEADSVEVHIQADRIMRDGSETNPNETVLEKLTKNWKQANQDIRLPAETTLEIKQSGSSRVLIVKMPVNEKLRFRPWLGGTRYVKVFYRKQGQEKEKRFSRERDYFYTTDFPLSSYMVAESHTQGAPFLHGIGILLKPEMNSREARSEDPILKLKGADTYRYLGWNKKTGWADVMFGPRGAD